MSSRPSTAPACSAAFEQPGGEALREHIDDMSNEEYQSLFAITGR